MTNISIQSHNNGYLSGLSNLSSLSPYVPFSTQHHHQLHAAAAHSNIHSHHHSIMPPPAQINHQNLDTSSFQYAAYHPNNGYSTIPIHAHNARSAVDNLNAASTTPLLAGYALSTQHHPTSHHHHQLVSQPWPSLQTHHPHHHPNQLGHLHSIQPTHSMQSSPGSASNLNTHSQPINLQHQQQPYLACCVYYSTTNEC